jgi:putative phage-type endonuclease
MFLSELEDLKDELDTLLFEDDPYLITNEVELEIIESTLHLIDEFVKNNSDIIFDSDFHDILLEEIQTLFYIQIEDIVLFDDLFDIEEDIDELLQEALNIYIISFCSDNFVEIKKDEIKNYEDIEQKIQKLREIPQPVQRTPEWYQFRSNLITASNAWKAFESQSAINQLIYEKCQPIKSIDENENENIKVVNSVNTNTPMHHGQKYEPLSVMLYETIYKTKIEDFGCIQHPKYYFLGASPDGINVDIKSERYGRMLEIKNPVSREITGIPKKEYWVQMQLQMEVCDLDECDFLETKFVEYPNRNSYESDLSLNSNYKGVIIQFYTNEGIPFYSYRPLDLIIEEDILNWEIETINFYESEPYNYYFTKYIYWKLEKISCILVLRDRDWFQKNIGQLEKVWKIIEEERITGYQHRAPTKRVANNATLNTQTSLKKEEPNLFTFLSIKKLSSPNPPLEKVEPNE